MGGDGARGRGGEVDGEPGPGPNVGVLEAQDQGAVGRAQEQRQAAAGVEGSDAHQLAQRDQLARSRTIIAR